jgi:hypothetical protein
VKFSLLSFYPGEKAFGMHRRLGGSKCRSGRCEEEENLLPLSEIEPQSLGLPAHSPSQYRLSRNVGSKNSDVRNHLPMFILLYALRRRV